MTAGVPQHMREAMRLKGVVALEIKQRVDQPPAGGIALGDSQEVGAERIAKAWLEVEMARGALPP